MAAAAVCVTLLGGGVAVAATGGAAFLADLLSGDAQAQAEMPAHEAHEGCALDSLADGAQPVAWSDPARTEADAAVTVTSYAELASAMGSAGVTDIVLDTGDGSEAETWHYAGTQAQVPSGRTVHVSVAAGKTVTLAKERSGDPALFRVEAGGTLVLGDGTAAPTGSVEADGAAVGIDYAVEQAGGNLVIDGGAVWEEAGQNPTAYFVSASGERVGYRNVGFSTTSGLVKNNGGVLSVWKGVTLQNVQRSNGSYGGSAIDMQVGSVAPDMELNLYGGVVQWCAATGIGENGAGAIYLGPASNSVLGWTTHPQTTRYGTFNMYAGSVSNNATCNNDGNADGTGIALDNAAFNLYGGTVSFNCGDGGLYGDAGAADGGGIGARVGSQVRLYGGEVSYNWTGGYGGGVCLWNSDGWLYGTTVRDNTAGYGGGIAIAGCDAGGAADDSGGTFSTLHMSGGTVAYNTAEVHNGLQVSGVGGGICAGTAGRPNGSVLHLTGGTIQQNAARTGGGIGVYAGKTTQVRMSGEAAITGNTALENGNGAYFTNNINVDVSGDPDRVLLAMEGGARIDSDNPVYFDGLRSTTVKQLPVQVTGALTCDGAAAIFELSGSIWELGDDELDGRDIVTFKDKDGKPLDIQENKFSLDSTEWYLKANDGNRSANSGTTNTSVLELKKFADTPLYTIRNGTPVTMAGDDGVARKYYRVYTSLDEAFAEAADGDTLYIFYNTTVDTMAEIAGKHVSLVAESTSSAGRDASLSGSGANKTCYLENAAGYNVMTGEFLAYVGADDDGTPKGDYTVESDADADADGLVATRDGDDAAYTLLTDYSYNVRNDYTVTLSNALYLGDAGKGGDATAGATGADKPSGEAAVVVTGKGSLSIGQVSELGMGAGSLTFDGNLSSPTEGAFFQVGADSELTLHSGITIKNHANYSELHPGTIEVLKGGTLTVNDGVAITGGVSPVAGAIYNAGTLNLSGGSIEGNTGAVPRYGYSSDSSAAGAKVDGYDTGYWGQAKYYRGAGAVYNVGTLSMTGGTVSGNRGEYGALANMGEGIMRLSGGTVSGNAAVTGTGSGTEYDLAISGYTEGAAPAAPAAADAAGSGGGLFVGGAYGSAEAAADKVVVSGTAITGNWAQNDGGGIAQAPARGLAATSVTYTPVGGDAFEAGHPAYVPTFTGSGLEGAFGGGTGDTGDPDADAATGVHAGGLDVQAGSVSSNVAGANGGGLYVSGTAHTAAGVTLQRNSAGENGGGGGVAVATANGSFTFANEIRENTSAHNGGGIFVIGGKAQATEPKAVLAANVAADSGGGAFVNMGASFTLAAGAISGNTAGSEGAGAYVQTSAGAGIGGGSGSTAAGRFALSGTGYVNNADRIHLAPGALLDMTSGDWDTADNASGYVNTKTNPVTLDSDETAMGTDLIWAQSADAAQRIIADGLVVHAQGLTLGQDAANQSIVEINSYTLTFHDRVEGLESDDRLEAHEAQQHYGANATATLPNLDAFEGFAAPEGKRLTGWVVIAQDENGTWRYVSAADGSSLTDNANEALVYAVGASVTVAADMHLLAQFSDANYTITLQNGNGDAVENGTVNLENAAYDNTNYYVGFDQSIVIAPKADRGDDQKEYRLRQLKVYEKVSLNGEYGFGQLQDAYPGNYVVTGAANSTSRAYWRLASAAVVDEHTGLITGTECYTYDAAGVPTLVAEGDIDPADLEPGTAAPANGGAALAYQTTSADMLVRCDFEPGDVRLDVYTQEAVDADGSGSEVVTSDVPVYTGWFDDCAAAYTELSEQYEAIAGADGANAETALANTRFTAAVTLVGDATDVEYGTVSSGGGNRAVYPYLDLTFDLNGHTLDLGAMGTQAIGGNTQFSLVDGTLEASIDAAGTEETPSRVYVQPLFLVDAGGTLTVTNLTIEASPEDKNTGEDATAYTHDNPLEVNVKVKPGGTLNTDQSSSLGSVYLTHGMTSDGQSTTEGHASVTVHGTFDERGADDPLIAHVYVANLGDYESGARTIFQLDDAVVSASGHNIRSWFDLRDATLDDTELGEGGDGVKDDAPYWFIGTDGKLYRRVADVVPTVICTDAKTDHAGVVNTYWAYDEDLPNGGGGNPQYEVYGSIGGNPRAFPVYYQYWREYGYDMSEHELAIGVSVADGYGNRLSSASGSATVSVTRVSSGGNAQDTSQVLVRPGMSVNGGYAEVLVTSSGADVTANAFGKTDGPTPYDNDPQSSYYISAQWTGSGQYASAYRAYWMMPDDDAQLSENAVNANAEAGTVTGTAKMLVAPKDLANEESVVIESVTPEQVGFIGQAGADAGHSSSPSTASITDENTGRALIVGSDVRLCYRLIGTAEEYQVAHPDHDSAAMAAALAGEKDDTAYYYLDDRFYTRDGSSGNDGSSPDQGIRLDGADAGTYSVELWSENSGNYVGRSGWKGTTFTIAPYAGRLETSEMGNAVVVDPQTDNYQEVIKELIGGTYEGEGGQLCVRDSYGNMLELENLSFSFQAIDGGATLDENGWPASEGLYALCATPRANASDNNLAFVESGQAGFDPNYASSAMAWQAILVTDEPLTMEIQARNDATDEWSADTRLEVPYTGNAYADTDIKAYDLGDEAEGDQLRVVLGAAAGDEAGRRLATSEYSLRVGLPANPALGVGEYLLLATDSTGDYIAISTVLVTANPEIKVDIQPAEGVYTGYAHTPALSVLSADDTPLVDGRDYATALQMRHDKDGEEAWDASSTITNVGEYRYRVAGLGNYADPDASGQRVVYANYEVKPKDLANKSDVNETAGVPAVNISMERVSLVPQSTQVFVTYNGFLLQQGTDYEVKVLDANDNDVTSSITNPGEYTYVITGINNFTGTVERPYTVLDAGDMGAGIDVSPASSTFTYSATTLDGYGWLYDASATAALAGGVEEIDLDLSRCSAELGTLSVGDGGSVAFVPVSGGIPDVGAYVVRVQPQADYAEELVAQGVERDSLTGYANVAIQPREVTVTVENVQKVYGENDPVLAKYGTNLSAVSTSTAAIAENGFYERDAASVTGTFGRAAGETYRYAGYRYAIGTFTAGGNYTLRLASDTAFMIQQKDIEDEDDVDVALAGVQGESGMLRLSYVGRPVSPVQDGSVVYRSQRGDIVLAESRDYVLSYEVLAEGGSPDDPEAWTPIAEAPVDVGVYRVTLSSTACVVEPNNYRGERQYVFEVAGASGNLDITLTGADGTVTYTGAAFKPGVEVRTEGGIAPIVQAGNFSVTYQKDGGDPLPFSPGATNLTDAGRYAITVSGIGNYTGAYGEAEFVILPKNLAEDDSEHGTQPVAIEVDGADGLTYNGKAQTPGVAASYAGADADPDATGMQLVAGADYTLAYANNTNAGTNTAQVTVYGAGNYTGSRTLTFGIAPQTVYVKVLGASKVYGAIDPAYTYEAYTEWSAPAAGDGTGDGAGGAGADESGFVAGSKIDGFAFTGAVGRAEGEDVGSYAFDLGTLSASSNYRLVLPEGAGQSLEITPKSLGDGTTPESGISASNVTYLAADQSFGDIKKGIAVSYWASALGQQSLKMGEDGDYTVSIFDDENQEVDDNDKPEANGKYTIKVEAVTAAEGQAAKNYTGSFSLSATAVDAAYLLSLGGNESFTYTNDAERPNRVTVSPTTNSSGALGGCTYEVMFDGQRHSHTVGENETSYSYTLGDAGTYTITVTKVIGSEDNPQVYYGQMTVTVKPKNIAEGNADDGTAPVELVEGFANSPRDYTGDAVTFGDAALLSYNDAEVAANENGVLNYVVGYEDNVKPNSTAKVTITGVGNYTGTRTFTFLIGSMTYAVSYDANGGTGAPDPTTTQGGVVLPSGANMTHGQANGQNVVFIGWSPEKMANPLAAGETTQLAGVRYAGQSVDIGTTWANYVSEDGHLTLYAVWGIDANANGVADVNETGVRVVYYPGTEGTTGAAPTDAMQYLPGQTAHVSQGSLTLTSYVLMGWTTSEPADGTGHRAHTLADYTALGAVVGKDMSATFVVGSGELVDGSRLHRMYAVWGVDANGNGTADWLDAQAVPVFYDANGGAGAPDTGVGTPGEDFRVSGVEPARTGAVFLGWTAARYDVVESADAVPSAGDVFAAGVTVTLPEGDGTTPVTSVTLYALWAADANNNGTPDYEEGRYALAYGSVADGVTATGLPAGGGDYLAGAAATLSGEVPAGTLEGGAEAVFLGWTTDADAARTLYTRENRAPGDLLGAGAVVTLPDKMPAAGETETVTYYAVWGAADYANGTVEVIAYVAGGSGTASPAVAQAVEGGSVQVTFMPAAGYVIEGVAASDAEGNPVGVSAGAVDGTTGAATYTVGPVERTTTVAATMKQRSFAVEKPLYEVDHDGSSYAGYAAGLGLAVLDGDAPVDANLYAVTVTPVGSADAVGLDTPLAVGYYQVTVTGKDGSTYEGVSAGTILHVEEKSLVLYVAPEALSKTFGAADPDGLANAYKLYWDEAAMQEVSDSDLAALNVSGALARVAGEDAGSYAYVPDGLSASKEGAAVTFALVENANQFTIAQKEIAGEAGASAFARIADDVVDALADVRSASLLAEGMLATPADLLTAGLSCRADGSGAPVAPEFALAYQSALGTFQLQEGADYAVEYAQAGTDEFSGGTPSEPGIYAVKVTGMGNYTGSVTFPLVVEEPLGSYTVEYNLGSAGGTPPASQAVTAGQAVEVAAVPEGMELAGHTFVGWTPDGGALLNDAGDVAIEQAADLAHEVTLYQAGGTFVPTANVTLRPVWVVDAVAEQFVLVSYDANGGAAAAGALPAPELVLAGGKHVVTSVEPAREGCEFLGWTAERADVLAAGTAVPEGVEVYAAGDEVALEAQAGDGGNVTAWTFHALWRAVEPVVEPQPSIGVAYVAPEGAEGELPEDAAKYFAGDEVTLLGGDHLKLPAAEGAPAGVFVGWTTDAELAGGLLEAEPAAGALLASYGTYAIPADAAEGSTVTFHAVFAADANANGVADYAEDKFSVTYSKGSAEGVSGNAPADDGKYLSGQKATVLGAGGLGLAGHTFLGWTPGGQGALVDDAAGLLGVHPIYQEGDTVTVTGNVELAPVWVDDALLAEYGAVAYSPNGGDDARMDVFGRLVAVGERYEVENLGEHAPERAGCVFLGWTTARHAGVVDGVAGEDGSPAGAKAGDYLVGAGTAGAQVVAADGVYGEGDGFEVPQGVTVLYALWGADANNNGMPDWEEDRYGVAYALAPGAGVALDEGLALPVDDVAYLEGVAVPVADAALAGAAGEAGAERAVRLAGWSADAALAAAVYEAGAVPQGVLAPGGTVEMPAGGLTLYAVWEYVPVDDPDDPDGPDNPGGDPDDPNNPDDPDDPDNPGGDPDDPDDPDSDNGGNNNGGGSGNGSGNGTGAAANTLAKTGDNKPVAALALAATAALSAAALAASRRRFS